MKTLGFQTAMPEFLNGKAQFSAEEANRTRFVTKTRWVVESGRYKSFEHSCFILNIYIVNGKIKQWRYFNQVLKNSSICHVGDDLNVVCAIINAYCERSVSHPRDGGDIANTMLEQLEKDNILEKRLNELQQMRTLKWIKHDATMCLFPSLTPTDVENLTFGRITLISVCKQPISFQALIKYIKQSHIYTIN